ncbi:MAG TPA: SDR family oxidoreductase [Alphaproteobacteria bacterium]|jgi:3-oxoacyl-[acyl-carrier protein] reductase|nr:SDR family oxidoreductase [Alphaproteobacteria bacterium]
MTLAGYSVLVTGASEGIGRGMALAAGKAGAGVVVSALDITGAEGVAEEIRGRGGHAVPARCDVTRRSDTEAAVACALAAFGRLDAVIHNANNTGAGASSVQQIADSHWQPSVAVGLRPIFYTARAALPALIDSGGSMIVMTSQSGIDGTVTLPVYSAVKGAQRALVKSLAREWGPLGVRVNAIAPSAMTPAQVAYLEREPHMRAHLIMRSPLRRMGDAENDIGRAVGFLISRESGFITGQTLVVNGGALML